ncbi:hypothetical protein IL306_013512 [Fusarium sp. DS 682]|nr:hypothetical protein IL306_013512 [Fusarium sp. DS 682]
MSSASDQATFDHSKVNFTKLGPRRVHMEEFFRHLGLWNPEQVKALREMSEERVCGRHNDIGDRQVGQAYFEYMVDMYVWHSILTNSNSLGKGHEWPWPVNACPHKKDLSEGVSRVYREWLRRHKTRELQSLIYSNQMIELKTIDKYRNYLPTGTLIECHFGGCSAMFPAQAIKHASKKGLEDHIFGFLWGAFPSRVSFYDRDEALLRVRYKLVRQG